MELDIVMEPTQHPAKLIHIDQNRCIITSPKAYPPGAPCTMRFSLDEKETRVDMRVIGSKRKTESLFEVTLRFVSLPKFIRQQFEHFFHTS